jgi:phosphoribosylglycinamide formyltransferase-1
MTAATTSTVAGPLRVVVLASGRGSNLRAIAERIDRGELPVRIVAVVSDRPQAAALDWARTRAIPAEALQPSGFPDRDAYGAALADRVAAHAPQLVVLAGFMRILSDGFVERFAGRLLNIHPSLLPLYPGLHTHRRALAAGDAEHGASVHFVTAELDGGPVVIQARVPVHPGDDEATLAARVLREEHEIYPRCIGWFASGRLHWRDGRPWLDGRPLDAPVTLRSDATETPAP